MKKKLLFIVHSLGIGGAEHLVVQISLELKKEYEVAILCLDSRGKMWNFCQKQGIKLFCAEREPGFSLKNFIKVNRLIVEFAPDVIHAHQYTPFVYSASAKLMRKTKAEIVFTEHGRNYPDQISTKRKKANKLLLPKASVVTAVCEFAKKALIEIEGVRSDVEVVYNGIKPPVVKSSKEKSLREEFKIASDVKIIGMLGSLRPVKNPSFLLKAFAVVKQVMPNVALVYVGDGELRPSLESEVKNMKLGSDVFFAGTRWPASNYMKEFSVFALPSLQEACSLAILESMSMEIPVIVTNTGGSPELITANTSGIVVECDDERELASGIIELLTNTELRDKLVRNAKQDSEDRFSFNAMLSSYQRIYENLLQKSA